MWFKPILRSFAKTSSIMTNTARHISLTKVSSISTFGALTLSNYQLHNLV